MGDILQFIFVTKITKNPFSSNSIVGCIHCESANRLSIEPSTPSLTPVHRANVLDGAKIAVESQLWKIGFIQLPATKMAHSWRVRSLSQSGRKRHMILVWKERWYTNHPKMVTDINIIVIGFILPTKNETRWKCQARIHANRQILWPKIS